MLQLRQHIYFYEVNNTDLGNDQKVPLMFFKALDYVSSATYMLVVCGP
jgi:hypothetical protein